MTHYTPPLRLSLSGDALLSNWRWLAERSGPAACGAAVKADGYGLGAREVVSRLRSAGCGDFFVATWAEAAELATELKPAFQALHDVDLARLENPRTGERMWDVSSNL